MSNQFLSFVQLILITVILLTCTKLDAQPSTWQNYWGGYNMEVGNAIQQTNDGGFIIAGATFSFGAGLSDVYLVKTDSLGNTEWTRTYGGPGEDFAKSVKQTRDGGYIIAGHTTSYGAGGYDVYLIKTNSQGDTLWTKTYGTSNDERGVCLQITHDDGYIIAKNYFNLIKTDSLGNVQWDTFYDIHPGTAAWDDEASWIEQTIDGGYIITGQCKIWSSTLFDICLIKTNSLGVLQWSQIYQEGLSEFANSVQQTPDGYYLIAGSTESFGAGGSDAWLIKADALGNKVWSLPFGGRYNDYGGFIELTSDGNYLLGGTNDSFSPNRYDAWLLKLNTDGVILGSEYTGGSFEEYGLAGQQTADGGYVVVGYTDSYGAGATDVYAAKINIAEPQSRLLQKMNEYFEFYDGPALLPDMFIYPIRSQKSLTNDPSLLDNNDLWVLFCYPEKISFMSNNNINGEIDMNNWYRDSGPIQTDEFSFDLSQLGNYIPSDIREIMTNFLHIDYENGPWAVQAEPILQSNGAIDTVLAEYPIYWDHEQAGTGSMTIWYDSQIQDLQAEVHDYIYDLSDSISLPIPLWSYDTVQVKIPLIPDSVQATYIKIFTPYNLRSMSRMKAPETQNPFPTIEDLVPQSFLLSYLVQTDISYHMNIQTPFMNFDIDTLGTLDCLLEIILSYYDYQPGEVIESPLYPSQLTYSDIEIFPPLINFWIHNDLQTPFIENNLHFEYSLGTGEIHSTLPDSAIQSHHLVVLGEGPIDLELTDPESMTITKIINPVSNSIYVEDDVNGDLQQDDLILIPYGKPDGDYQVQVQAESGALPTDTYTLRAAFDDTVVILAQNVTISNIPSTPYIIQQLYTDIRGAITESTVPEKWILYQNYPNPFNPSTKIKYTLPKSSKVKIEIFNLLGQKIETILNKQMPAGLHEVEFTAMDLPSGVYLYRIATGNYVETKKMLLLK
jgi:predicted secreted protein